MYRHGLVKLPNLKLHENMSSGYRNVSCRQTDRQTDRQTARWADMTVMSPSVAFNTCYANAPTEEHRTRYH